MAVKFQNSMKVAVLSFDAVDPVLGRLNSQQALMEMAMEGIISKEKICGDRNEPKHMDNWKGVMIDEGEFVENKWR